MSVDPVPKGRNPRVDPRVLGQTASATPRNDANLGPLPFLLQFDKWIYA